MSDRYLVSVIVPCRNEKYYVEGFIRSVLSQEFDRGEIEVIVADGMSDDGTREILRIKSSGRIGLKVIDNPEQTIPSGLNRAIQAATGEIIVRMDVHTEYAPDYVKQCISALERTGADNVGGPARTKANGYVQAAVCLGYHSLFGVGGAKFHNLNYEGYVDTVTYGCWKRATLFELGFFDPDLIRNEDDELNLRLIRSGGEIWQTPDIQSWYYPRSSLGSLFKQYAQYGYWKVRVLQKHKLPAAIRHIVPGGFILCIGALFVLSFFSVIAEVVFFIVIGLYVLANLIASLMTCWKPVRHKYLPIMPFIFAVYHFGYGYGFLRGVVDFVFLGTKSREAFTELTRS